MNSTGEIGSFKILMTKNRKNTLAEQELIHSNYVYSACIVTVLFIY